MKRSMIKAKLRLWLGCVLMWAAVSLAPIEALADEPAWFSSLRPLVAQAIAAREPDDLKSALRSLKSALEGAASQVQGTESADFYAMVLFYCEFQNSWMVAQSGASGGRGVLRQYDELTIELSDDFARHLMSYLQANGTALHLAPQTLLLETRPAGNGKVKIQAPQEVLSALAIRAQVTKPSTALMQQQLKVGALKSMALAQAELNSLLYPSDRIVLPTSARSEDDAAWARAITQQSQELVAESRFRRRHLPAWIQALAMAHPLVSGGRSVAYGQLLGNLEYDLLTGFGSHRDPSKAPDIAASVRGYLANSPRGETRRQFILLELTRSSVKFSQLRGEALKHELTEALIAAESKFFKVTFGCHFFLDQAGAESQCLGKRSPTRVYELSNGWTRAELAAFNEMVVRGWRAIFEAHPISDRVLGLIENSVSDESETAVHRLAFAQKLIGGARKLKELGALYRSLPTDLDIPSSITVTPESFRNTFGGDPIPGYVMMALNRISPNRPTDLPWMQEALNFVSGRVAEEGANREAWAGVLNRLAPAIAQQSNRIWNVAIEGHEAEDVQARLEGRDNVARSIWDRIQSAFEEDYDRSLPTLRLAKNASVAAVANARALLLNEPGYAGSSVDRQIDVLIERLGADAGRNANAIELLKGFSQLLALADEMSMSALRSQVRDAFVQCMDGDILGIYRIAQGAIGFSSFLGERRAWLQALFASPQERLASMYTFLSNGHVLKQYTALVISDLEYELPALTYVKRQEGTQPVRLAELINGLDEVTPGNLSINRSLRELPLQPLISAAMLRAQQSSSWVDQLMNEVREAALPAPVPVSDPRWEPSRINEKEYEALSRIRATLPLERERKERLTLLVVSAALEPYLRTYARDNARGFGDLLSGAAGVQEMLQRSQSFARLASLLYYEQGEALGQMAHAQRRTIERLSALRSVTEQVNQSLLMGVTANIMFSWAVPESRWLSAFFHKSLLFSVPADLALNVAQVHAYAQEYGNIGSYTSAGFFGEGVVTNAQVDESMFSFLHHANVLRERLPLDLLFFGSAFMEMLRPATVDVVQANGGGSGSGPGGHLRYGIGLPPDGPGPNNPSRGRTFNGPENESINERRDNDGAAGVAH